MSDELTLYPILCHRCKTFMGYSETDFEDVNELCINNYCGYCVKFIIKPLVTKGDNG